MSSSPFRNLQSDPIPTEQIIGNGSSAVVLLQNNVAVKTPLKYLWSSDYEVEANTDSLRREQDVYRRLQNPEDSRSTGVVRCIDFSPESTVLAYMPNGDLRTYLQRAKYRPSHRQKFTWFQEMARTLSYIHDRRVLIADIATRNFLVDSDLSIKLCDFSEASLLSLDSNMEDVDDNGYTTQIDIGFLGAVMYEVVTGTKCEVDLFKDNAPTDGRAYWPERRFLPSTEGSWIGRVIEGCWNGEFRNAHSLLETLQSVELDLSPFVVSRVADFLLRVKDYVRDRLFTVFLGTLGLTVFGLMAGRKIFLDAIGFLSISVLSYCIFPPS
ncbi:STYKc [Aspergillus sclerotialis]|uniref:STYKc n=1 Tax=Aspergillus sclerotialis TaxID=2070753 RepID=A0A3A2ZLS1_9EURO|nr:STYKc [Aspergillus sclerotialis]